MKGFYKDEVLNDLAETNNVAQFVSFSPEGAVRFRRIYGREGPIRVNTTLGHIKTILHASGERSVNVRSFLPDQPRSNEFIYGLKDEYEVFEHIKRLGAQGLYTIVNETVDVNDGGVSGVLQNNMVEFAPGVVPRFVETSEEMISTFPKELASDILGYVYNIDPHITDYSSNTRLEFSVHPKLRGYKKSHTIIWEKEQVPFTEVPYFLSWPTAFSRHIGDKAYGIMMADILGLPVPRTTVFPRNNRLKPFSFGKPTSSSNKWLRTCPNIQVPGKYTTTRTWQDPYELMEKDDPSGKILASCLSQWEVPAEYSGALLSNGNEVIVEGVYGFGDDFMQATTEPIELPSRIVEDVVDLYDQAKNILGPVRFEWAHDGQTAWILQLHTGAVSSSGRIVVPGKFKDKIEFDVTEGLETLRTLIENIKPGVGIVVNGNVGMSSHIADMLRKAEVPSVLAEPKLKTKEHKNE